MSKLRVERVECVALSMPLPRTFRGSNYFMTHRCTIITRVYTAEGIVGECYNGDEFETQGEVLKIITDEIAPRIKGMDAFNIEGCWQAMLPPSPTTFEAADSYFKAGTVTFTAADETVAGDCHYSTVPKQ